MIAIIPARGGSKRIPKKNIRLFHGKPIIQYSIDAARESGIFDKIIVSTDSKEIADVVSGNPENAGVTIHWRSKDLSVDEIGTQEVASAVIAEKNIIDKVTCVIYPCAPMLGRETLINAEKAFFLLQVMTYLVPVGEWLSDPGQFYMGWTEDFVKGTHLNIATTIFPVDPRTCCDINTEEDWKKAEKMYEELNK